MLQGPHLSPSNLTPSPDPQNEHAHHEYILHHQVEVLQ